MVKGLPRLSLRGIITAVNAVRRISSEAGRASKDKVARMLTRTVTLFRRPRNRTVVSELTVADWNCSDEVEQHAKIETLPDEILLEIFDCSRLAAAAATESDSNGFYDPPSSAGPTWRSWQWHRLVHVCRRWRSLVFASPHRLDLRVVYTFKQPARVGVKAPNSWQTLPIAKQRTRTIPDSRG